jgi:hypothetical protein
VPHHPSKKFLAILVGLAGCELLDEQSHFMGFTFNLHHQAIGQLTLEDGLTAENAVVRMEEDVPVAQPAEYRLEIVDAMFPQQLLNVRECLHQLVGCNVMVDLLTVIPLLHLGSRLHHALYGWDVHLVPLEVRQVLHFVLFVHPTHGGSVDADGIRLQRVLRLRQGDGSVHVRLGLDEYKPICVFGYDTFEVFIVESGTPTTDSSLLAHALVEHEELQFVRTERSGT